VEQGRPGLGMRLNPSVSLSVESLRERYFLTRGVWNLTESGGVDLENAEHRSSDWSHAKCPDDQSPGYPL